MIKSALLKTFPKLTEKHVKIYGWALFVIGMLYQTYSLLLFVCYLPVGGVLVRGLALVWLGSALTKKNYEEK